MKAHKFLLGIFALAAIAIACDDDEEDYVIPTMSIDKTALSFDEAGGATAAQTVNITSNRDWEATCDADWVFFSPSSGKASDNSVEVSVYVDANTGTDRTAKLTFDGQTVSAVVTISQTGPSGESYGAGTADSPYTVSDALTIINAGSYTSKNVYVKGIISSISEVDTGNYGNATYYISDDGTTDEHLEVYRGYSLGGAKFTSSDEIQVGDEVIVYGELTMYGTTPEITQGSKIYYLNGETADVGDVGDHELVGDGTVSNPYTATDALWLANSGNYTDDEVYVKGIISQIDEISTSYGNATYYISDDGTTDEHLEVYRGYSLDGAKFTSSTEIEVGDKVVVCGVITMFYSTPEMTTGSKIVSLEKGEGNTGGGDEGGDDEEEGDLVYGNDFDKSVVSSNTTITSSVTAYQNETGSGASDISYNWSSKMSVRVSNGSAGAYTNASGNNNIFFGAEDAGYFVIKNIALPSGETNYKLTFGAREDSNVFATGTFKLYVSQDNSAWVQLTYDFPSGNTSSGSWALASTTFTVPSGTSTLYIYYEADVQSVYRIDDMRLTVSSTSGTSIDFSTGVTLEGGDSGGSDEGGDEGGDTPETDGDGTVDNPYSASEAIALVASGSYPNESVYIKGIVSQIDDLNSTYGELNYHISDDGTTDNQLYVYNGYGFGGERIESEDYLSVGDELVIYGKLQSYYGSAEVNYGSIIYSLNGQTYEAPEHDDDDPYVQNVTWTLGNHASDDKAYINGSADTYDILKLGTGSALGDASCTVPAGTKALHFYCIGWNGKGDAPFKVTVGEEDFEGSGTQNSGLANSTPYTITLSDSDYFEFELSSVLTADTTVTFETTGNASSNGRVGVIGFKYITD